MIHQFWNVTNPSLRRWFCFLALTALLTGCQRDEVRVYRVPKEQDEAAPQAAQNSGQPTLSWTLPAGWVEHPPEQMRVASFSVSGTNGEDADIAIIPLPGVEGRDLDIVNMWRDKVKLPHVTDDELAKQVENVTVGDRPAKLYELVSTEPLVDSKYPMRIVVAMFTEGTTSWFFKITGEDSLVQAQKPAFLDFLKSISFGSGPVDIVSAPPQMSANAPLPQPGMGDAGLPVWNPPADWQSVAPGPMLAAKFSIAGAGDAKADVNINSSAGMGGGVLPNINRWRGQLGLPPTDESGLSSLATSLDVPGTQAMVVDMSGTNQRTGEAARTVAVIVPEGGQTWFYKLMGNGEVVEKQKAAFLQFVQTVKYPGSRAEVASQSPPTSVSVAPMPSGPVGGSLPAWNPPSNWQSVEPGPMLAAKFTIVGTGDTKADVNINSMAGLGGGALANVNRWRGQLGLPPTDDSGLGSLVGSLDVPGSKAMLVDMSGTNQRTGEAARMVAVIVPQNSQTWFYKLMGNGGVVEKEKTAFLQFVQTAKYPDAP